MRVLIGIDDTDNLESRGTGYRARRLGAWLMASGLARLKGITRHQLLVDAAIPYTSHNSSACLQVITESRLVDELVRSCRDYLRRESAAGADAGLCLVQEDRVGPILQDFGRQAQTRVLDRSAALQLAEDEEILLEGLTGDGGGIIGALAAVGLRATGNDGRFIWLPRLRELQGVYTAGQLLSTTGIEEIATLHGIRPPDTARIDLGSWARPILRGGKAVLLVEEVEDDAAGEWRVVPKEVIKQY
ncbi:MAG: hypothetical protein H5U00_09000 [Clostridia bacterium]|nr:hypothetical protein [Clostridia bacterium]